MKEQRRAKKKAAMRIARWRDLNCTDLNSGGVTTILHEFLRLILFARCYKSMQAHHIMVFGGGAHLNVNAHRVRACN